MVTGVSAQAQRRRAPRPNSGRRHAREQLLRMRSAKLSSENVLGWGLEARPKFKEEDVVDDAPATREQIPVKASLSEMMAPTTAPCDNTSRDAFLAIREALNLNKNADGTQINERTAQVCPLDIRFSQPSVQFVFGTSGMEISKVVPLINIVKQDAVDVLACPFPPIRCIWWEPKDGAEPGWFALDNRRLLALQQRTVQAEHPHQCLAEVIIVDRLPDPTMEKQRNFCKDGYEVFVSDGSRFSWPEALARVCEEKLEMNESDNASTTASDGPGSSGHGSLDPSPVHQAMGTKTDSPLTPVSLEKALGLEPSATGTKPQVLTSLEAALGLHPAACATPTNTAFSTAATLPPPLPASAPSPVDEAWNSLQVALGMEESSSPVPSPTNGMQQPYVLPDYATAMELMNFMAQASMANMALQASANGMNTSAAPWSPPAAAPDAAAPDSPTKAVELDKELSKAAAQVPVKTHLKAPYRRPTDDEIAARLQNITIKPSFTEMKPVGEETSYSDKENEEPVAAAVNVAEVKAVKVEKVEPQKFRI